MPINFIFVTDSHHYPSAPEDYGPPKMLTHSRTVMEAAVPKINALQPDFIVHGGDLLCGGSAFDLPWSTYLQSIQEVADVFAGFETPVYYIPGNHDADAQRGTFEAFAKEFPIPETIDVVEVMPRLRLARANIYHQCNPITQGNGVWTDVLDNALREAAEKAYDERCAMLLALHTWVLPNYEPRSTAGLLVGANRLLETVKAYPAIVALFTGHRHMNRLRMYRDFLVVDTACLIGFPMGFRFIQLGDDGYFTTRFHQLDLPELIRASFDRCDVETNNNWQGQIHDRDTEILLPRLREIWR
ncbi:MAG: metallophosphoesterase [Candidatus Poribacteria bacterium]|nr:metallophosphoesterase [Candidatus Poribacteria bacterium]